MNKYMLFTIAVAICFCTHICKGQTGMIVTVAGGGSSTGGPGIGDGQVAISPAVNFSRTTGVCTDPVGNIYISDFGRARVRKVDAVTHIINTIAGNGISGYSGDGGPATNAKLGSGPEGIRLDNSGNIYISDRDNNCIRKIDGITNTISTFVTGVTTDYIYIDTSNNIYFTTGHKLYVINATSLAITPVAGTGSSGYTGDGGQATAAQLYNPYGVAGDIHGNIYIADRGNNCIRKILPSGIISTIAGTGSSGYSGDGGPATSAQLQMPQSVGLDATGNIYFTDGGFTSEKKHIRKLDCSTGIISTVAGCLTSGCLENNFDTIGSPATSVTIDAYHAYVDILGNIYYSNYANEINKVSNSSTTTKFVSDSFSVSVNFLCNGPQLSIITYYYTSGMNIVTYYGDGTNDTTFILPGGGGGYATINHLYKSSGTYTIKQVLHNGLAPIDSITFSNPYSFCRTIPVEFYFDQNGNCTKDATEPHVYHASSIQVYANGVPIRILSATSGFNYDAYGIPGDIYSFKVLSSPGSSYISCPLSGTWSNTITSASSIPTNMIGYTCGTSTDFDLGEHIFSRCGKHSAKINILVDNTYCNPQNAIFTAQISNKYSNASASPTPSSIFGNTFTWNISDLSSTISLPFHINLSFENGIKLLPLGDTVHSNYIVTPISGDVNTSNNSAFFIDTVLSSFDPNEMSVLPSGHIHAGQKLQYTIHFENMGNDTAFNIYVMDTLSDYVDLNAFNIEASSAVMKTTLLNHYGYNVMRFDFPNINLLDSSHHNECEGLVRFNVKTKQGLAAGTHIFNHAGIYFDNNPVVITNTVENIIASPTYLIDPIVKDGITLFPNPTNEEITIKTNCQEYSSFVIYNSIGQQIMQGSIIQYQSKIKVNTLPTGLYYISLKGASMVKVLKFVKV